MTQTEQFVHGAGVADLWLSRMGRYGSLPSNCSNGTGCLAVVLADQTSATVGLHQSCTGCLTVVLADQTSAAAGLLQSYRVICHQTARSDSSQSNCTG